MAKESGIIAFWESKNGFQSSWHKGAESLQEIITKLEGILATANFEGKNGVSLIIQENRNPKGKAPRWYLNAFYEENGAIKKPVSKVEDEEELPF